ncbi:unnamed protein product [Prorocentrum cordatum]|uniref:Uncharacterized protein n=1 Tax=Prorocentrum cordatum TaxID=2364126 RepID=A0ABN9RLA9_9DINO|nr:unnamed protein product [Polarella glacialis]
MVAAAVRTSFDVSPEAVHGEVKARLAMVEQALPELVKAGPCGGPALNGEIEAVRSTGLHAGMGRGAEGLPQNGKEARLTAESCECEEGHSSESSNTSVANPQGILQLGAEGAEQKQVEGKVEVIGVSAAQYGKATQWSKDMAEEIASLQLAVVPDCMVDDRAEEIASVAQQLVAARAQFNQLCSRNLLERLQKWSAVQFSAGPGGGGPLSPSIGGFGISSVREFV